MVEETKQNDLDTYLRAYSLAHQFAGYLEDRKSKGEKAYAFDHWEVLYTADFIDALKRGWRFKDLEDAIDAAQTTKHRFVCCTPRRLFENGESVMKLVWMLRKKGQTIRQKLGERYASWYAENAGSFTAEAIEQTNDNEAVEKILTAEDELRAEPDVDEDVPILTLKTTGRFKCINPDCAYRFDTRELMHRHFSNCFKKAVEAEPDDLEEIAREESEDRLDDRYGIPPPYCPECYDEDEKAENWDKYAPRNADGGTMFNPWAEMDATCASETGAHHGC